MKSVVSILLLVVIFTAQAFGRNQLEKPANTNQGNANNSTQQPKPAKTVSDNQAPANNDKQTAESHPDQPTWWNADRGTWALVIVGIFGTVAAVWTLRILSGQLREMHDAGRLMDRQATAMEGQLAAMRGQLTAMESSSKQTDSLIQRAAEQVDAMRQQSISMEGQLREMKSSGEATREIAIAARESANAATQGVALAMNKERARVEIHVSEINPHAGTDSLNAAICWLENCGFTRAFIVDSKGKFLNSNSPDMESGQAPNRSLIYSEHIEQGERSDNAVLILEPNPYLREDDVLKIRKGEAFLHFYGFVKYRDIFDRLWEKRIHLRWTMRFGGIVTDSAGNSQKMSWWEPVGPPEENAEIQDNEGQKAN